LTCTSTRTCGNVGSGDHSHEVLHKRLTVRLLTQECAMCFDGTGPVADGEQQFGTLPGKGIFAAEPLCTLPQNLYCRLDKAQILQPLGDVPVTFHVDGAPPEQAGPNAQGGGVVATVCQYLPEQQTGVAVAGIPGAPYLQVRGSRSEIIGAP
jgi:hypothetical protein